MKLINKKTGKIANYKFVTSKDGNIRLTDGKTPLEDIWDFDSLEELFKYFEDYKPKEPLIKDEKIRKAVRAWAEANRDVNEVIYKYDTNKVYCELVDTESEAKIRFNFLFINELSTCQLYTIDELYGEVEE